MKSISNEDYNKVGRVLKRLSHIATRNTRDRNAQRQAIAILRKWENAEKRPIRDAKPKDDKLYSEGLYPRLRPFSGAQIVDAAVCSGWEPSEKSLSCWETMVEEANDFLANNYSSQ